MLQSKYRTHTRVEVFTHNGIKQLHFSHINKISGQRGTLNFPFQTDKSLFDQVEAIMLVNNICHNVTSVEKWKEYDGVEVFEVKFNRPLRKSAKNK